MWNVVTVTYTYHMLYYDEVSSNNLVITSRDKNSSFTIYHSLFYLTFFLLSKSLKPNVA